MNRKKLIFDLGNQKLGLPFISIKEIMELSEEAYKVNSLFRGLSQEDQAILAATFMGNIVNPMSFKPDTFIQAMSTEHRTLQQSVTRLMLQWLEHVASPEYRRDLRNESSHLVCKEMINGFNAMRGYDNMNPSKWLGFV